MKTVKAYLDSLPADRKKTLTQLRSLIRKYLPKGYEEAMNWGMITYQVPLKTFPKTYNKQPLMYAAIGSQKNHMALYLCNVYADKTLNQWFKDEFKKSGKKLDMGKSCLRFKALKDLPMPVIGKVIRSTPVKKYLQQYQKARS